MSNAITVPTQRKYSLVEDLTTVETDTTLALRPDGQNGLQWVSQAGGLVTTQATKVNISEDTDTGNYVITEGNSSLVGISVTVNVLDNTKEDVIFVVDLPNVVGSAANASLSVQLLVDGNVGDTSGTLPIGNTNRSLGFSLTSLRPLGSNGIFNIDVQITAVSGTITVDNATGANGTLFEYRDVTSTTASSMRRVNCLNASSLALTQEPVSLDTPIQVEYGVAKTGLHGVSLDVFGTVNFAQDFEGFVKINFKFGRTSSVGSANLYGRFLIDDVQLTDSVHAHLDDQDSQFPYAETVDITMSAGSTLKTQIWRDSEGGGTNNGGVFQGSPALVGALFSPCVSISISKNELI